MMNEAMLCSLVGLCGAVQSTIYTRIWYYIFITRAQCPHDRVCRI